MVSSRQRNEIRRRMRHIKDAIDADDKTEKDVEERTKMLYQYLHEEGIVWFDG